MELLQAVLLYFLAISYRIVPHSGRKLRLNYTNGQLIFCSSSIQYKVLNGKENIYFSVHLIISDFELTSVFSPFPKKFKSRKKKKLILILKIIVARKCCSRVFFINFKM